MSIGEYPPPWLATTGPATTGPATTGPAGQAGAGPRPAVDGDLSGRLTALARVIQIGAARTGPDGFSFPLLTEAEQLVARAGERLRMSANHTVAVLAGGTGSGKSSLFNQLAGVDFSAVGVIRPFTKEPHACVWGVDGAGPLLEWLRIPHRNRYARSSALGEGEASLRGLILIDLPDHDSVAAGASAETDRLVGLADLMVWVLDPQKYADAAVHSRYLTPLAGYSSVIAVVLNQADLLTPEQADDCVADLSRLLDSEGLHDARVLVTSARTGAGVDELRKVLAETVTARRAATDRITADLDVMAERFVPYAGEARGAGMESEAEDFSEVPPGSAMVLAESFGRAAGAAGVGQALQSARELRAVDYVGWPVSWLVDRALGRDPVRKLRLGNLWEELRGVSGGPAGAQQAEIDNALTAIGEQIGPTLPKPWSQTVRAAARSRRDEIPGALGMAIGESLPAENSVEPWWRLVAVWQGLLLGCAVTGVAWIGALLAIGVFHAARHALAIFSDAALLPWVIILIAAILMLGWLTASGCMSLVSSAALRERSRVEAHIRSRMMDVAEQLVLMPVKRELSEYARFCSALQTARR
ncbi:MAG TPA: YfjP family GTPase [Streptosporangiaceae bacterium]|nr:YfjP family GTPase [Streptosporangiaceae bacterium]